MAYITISDLRPAGADLFMDSESFLSELSDGELSVYGGGTPATTVPLSAAYCFKVSLAVTAGAAVVGAAVGGFIGWLSR
ncbi:hypothetical protein J5X98_23590 [Leptothermofonsia sichuanensis E412]|uniref:hypothetical protein n=1 Tax=Leptothermofonsia sichuanensis TaxID=2917832 RepID=UPI001CA649E9|nr:hypothetical protein [Leptothermofonsia sichuanensis]QZZ20215.1 hypothetical protein J5X98_23590 [Leptothermofonsia sichuanensis E412]